jgi:hypothetical protein
MVARRKPADAGILHSVLAATAAHGVDLRSVVLMAASLRPRNDDRPVTWLDLYLTDKADERRGLAVFLYKLDDDTTWEVESVQETWRGVWVSNINEAVAEQAYRLVVRHNLASRGWVWSRLMDMSYADAYCVLPYATSDRRGRNLVYSSAQGDYIAIMWHPSPAVERPEQMVIIRRTHRDLQVVAVVRRCPPTE